MLGNAYEDSMGPLIPAQENVTSWESRAAAIATPLETHLIAEPEKNLLVIMKNAIIQEILLSQ